MEYEADKRSYRVLTIVWNFTEAGAGRRTGQKRICERNGSQRKDPFREISVQSMNISPTAKTHRKSCTIGSGTDTGSVGKIPVSLISEILADRKFCRKQGPFCSPTHRWWRLKTHPRFNPSTRDNIQSGKSLNIAPPGGMRNILTHYETTSTRNINIWIKEAVYIFIPCAT